MMIDNSFFEIIAETCGISKEEAEEKRNLPDVWDSFSKVETILTVEEEFSVSFSQDEIVKIHSFDDLLLTLKEKKNEK